VDTEESNVIDNKISKERKVINSRKTKYNITDTNFDIKMFFREIVEYRIIAMLWEKSYEIISHEVIIVNIPIYKIKFNINPGKKIEVSIYV